MTKLERVLVVEDSAPLAETLRGLLERRAEEVRVASSVSAAREALADGTWDLLVLDFALPDGDGFDVLAHLAEAGRMPAVVAMSGTADPDETFRLAQLGVRAFIPKPLELDAFEHALEVALEHPPDLKPLLRATVGHVGVREVEESVRETMVDEALGQSGGSRKGAARLLSISRQLLQHILKRRG